MIEIEGDTIHVNFSEWTPEAYEVFLQSKRLPEYNLDYEWETDTYHLRCPARFAHIFGVDAAAADMGWDSISGHLFDYQKWISETALKAKRYAVWADTGLGKTHIQWEFARQVVHRTRRKVLFIVPLNILRQTVEIGRDHFALPEVSILDGRERMRAWCKSPGPGIGMVNPEKFIPRNGEPEIVSECQYLAGVVLDESSLLKSGGGKIKWSLIKSCKGIEYKLSCTATPAPNDTMEYASQGSFLEKLRNEGDILWTYFTRNKEGEWKVKEHAREAFYRFMSGWSVYLRSPAMYGFEDNLKDLPPPSVTEYRIEPTRSQMDMIHAVPDNEGQLSAFSNRHKLQMTHRIGYSQIAKGFRYAEDGIAVRVESRKPAFVADLIRSDLREGRQVLVWTVFDEEARIIEELLAGEGGVEALHGKIPKARRGEIVERFRTGKSRVLITKASLLGFGLNFQMCSSMVFSGLDDSYERMYQAIRRAYRYGQTKTVRVHIPYIPELEGTVWANVREKQAKFDRDATLQERYYLEAIRRKA